MCTAPPCPWTPHPPIAGKNRLRSPDSQPPVPVNSQGKEKETWSPQKSQPSSLSPLHSPTHAERDWNRLAQAGEPRTAEGEAMKDGRKSGQPQVLSSRHKASSHGWQAAHRLLGYRGKHGQRNQSPKCV